MSDHLFYLAGIFFYLRLIFFAISTALDVDFSKGSTIEELVEDIEATSRRNVWNYVFGYMMLLWLIVACIYAEERFAFAIILVGDIMVKLKNMKLFSPSRKMEAFCGFLFILELIVFGYILYTHYAR